MSSWTVLFFFFFVKRKHVNRLHNYIVVTMMSSDSHLHCMMRIYVVYFSTLIIFVSRVDLLHCTPIGIRYIKHICTHTHTHSHNMTVIEYKVFKRDCWVQSNLQFDTNGCWFKMPSLNPTMYCTVAQYIVEKKKLSISSGK